MSTRPMTVVTQVSPDQAALMRGQRAYVCNITEQDWLVPLTYSNFQVKGRMAGEAYRLTEITTRDTTIDMGDHKKIAFPITARDIADDVCRLVNSDAGEDSYFGVFVCAGQTPTDAELSEAHALLEKFYDKQIFVADMEWARSHNYYVITDVQRRAARSRGIDKEWAYEPRPMADCPACGEKLKPSVAVCKSCKAILNPGEARRWGLLPPDNETGPGPDAFPPQAPEPTAVPANQELTAQGKKPRQVKRMTDPDEK